VSFSGGGRAAGVHTGELLLELRDELVERRDLWSISVCSTAPDMPARTLPWCTAIFLSRKSARPRTPSLLRATPPERACSSASWCTSASMVRIAVSALVMAALALSSRCVREKTPSSTSRRMASCSTGRPARIVDGRPLVLCRTEMISAATSACRRVSEGAGKGAPAMPHLERRLVRLELVVQHAEVGELRVLSAAI
jgi:hypothetical protein